MRLKFVIPLVFAAAFVPGLRTAQAQTYAGGSTAGDLPATAEVVPGVAGLLYTSISGTTVATNGIYNADMYEITVASPASFTASTTAFVAGANNFDDQITLFNSSGAGIATNDDAASGGNQASLTVTSILAGNYFLLISGSGNYPVDTSGNEIFPNLTTGADPEGTYDATSNSPIGGYTGNSNEGGNYLIALSITPTGVPEPSSLAALAVGLGGLALVLHRRRLR